MDCMKIALFIVYHSNSVSEALFKAVAFGGDSDTIAAVVG